MRSIKTFVMLGTIIAVGMIGFTSSNTSSNTHVFTGKDDYDDDDDHINWKKFKNSDIYEQADGDLKDCFKEAHDRGDNLAGYEVEECEDDDDSY